MKASLLGALSKRGKFKGYLLGSAPSLRARPDDYLAWQALVSNLAPARVSVFGTMMVNHTRLDFAELDKAVTGSGLSLALQPIEPAFRWNLYASRHDVDRERKSIEAWLTRKRLCAETEKNS
jgi:hypothetical protein